MIHFWSYSGHEIDITSTSNDWQAEGQQWANDLGEPVQAMEYQGHEHWNDGVGLEWFEPEPVQLSLLGEPPQLVSSCSDAKNAHPER